MNLTLVHCWKEWRAQRALLLAYVGLVFSCLCLGFAMVPESWWQQEGQRAMALSWFVAAGVIGVVGFVAPGLVRGEFGAKDDQFVRRLPGALGVSFGGKLLFLVLASVALPLLGLCCGELFLLAFKQGRLDLFTGSRDGSLVFRMPWPAVMCGYAMLLATFVWAIGMWLPGGRMALGGTVLLVLLCGLVVTPVLRQSPNIEQGIDWQPWLWFVPPLGLGVAGWSWIKGRRGGGPLRSARVGLMAFAVGIVPPSLWLTDCVWDYHHPDLQHLASLDVRGVSPDARFVLANGAGHENFSRVPVRIDLTTGVAEQLGGIGVGLGLELLPVSTLRVNGAARYWRLSEWSVWNETFVCNDVLDLESGQRTAVGYDPDQLLSVLPRPLHDAVADEARRMTPLAAPDGRPAWIEDDCVCIRGADGGIERVPMETAGVRTVRPVGHGFVTYGKHSGVFDLTTRRWRTNVPRDAQVYLVRGVGIYLPEVFVTQGKWQRAVGDAAPEPCPELNGCRVLGLFDDDQLLCCQWRKGAASRVFLWRAADGVTTELSMPEALVDNAIQAIAPLYRQGSLLTRDPRGCIWLSRSGGWHEAILRLDVATRNVSIVLRRDRLDPYQLRLLAWPDATTALMQQGNQILRVDVDTGARTVLFPR